MVYSVGWFYTLPSNQQHTCYTLQLTVKVIILGATNQSVHKKTKLGENINMIPSTTMKIPLDFAWCLALCFISEKGKSFNLKSAV